MKITQKLAAFYVLWKQYREDPDEFVPTWRFVGEIYIKELNEWYMMSYKCPTNGLVIFFDNPRLIERRYKTGKSGAKYYEYKIRDGVTAQDIDDPKLLEFYKLIRANVYE